MWSKDKDVQADCIKVLYEVGYIDPTLVAGYAGDFVKLLDSRNNRLVWGGMIALGTVAQLKPDLVFAHLDQIKKTMREGSVIAVDNAVLVLARAASAGEKYRRVMFPLLINHLMTCRPKDVPQHSEKIASGGDRGQQRRIRLSSCEAPARSLRVGPCAREEGDSPG